MAIRVNPSDLCSLTEIKIAGGISGLAQWPSQFPGRFVMVAVHGLSRPATSCSFTEQIERMTETNTVSSVTQQ